MNVRAFYIVYSVGRLVFFLLAVGGVAGCRAHPDRSGRFAHEIGAAALQASDSVAVKTYASASVRPQFVRVWTTKDGLPGNHVSALALSPTGFLWIGTGNGLARFDGVTFHVFALDDLPTWSTSYVRALHTASDGRILAVSNAGEIATVEPKSIFPVSRGALLRQKGEGIPFGAAETSDGTLWVPLGPGGAVKWVAGSDPVFLDSAYGLPRNVRGFAYVQGILWAFSSQQIFRWSGSRFQVVPSTIKPAVWAALGDTLWVGSADTVGRWDGAGFKLEGPVSLKAGEKVLTFGPGGAVWIQGEQGVRRVDRHGQAYGILQTSQVALDMGVPRLRGRRIVWLADRQGDSGSRVLHTISVDAGGRSDTLRLPDRWTPNNVMDVLDTQEGRWIATSSGLVATQETFVLRVGRNLGPQGLVFSTLASGDGAIWAGTWGEGLWEKQIGESVFRPKGFLPWARTLLSVSPDILWAGGSGASGQGEAVCIESDAVRARIAFASSVHVLYQGSKDTLWAGTEDGLYSIVGRTCGEARIRDTFLTGNLVRTVRSGLQGQLWVGGSSGVWRRTGKRWNPVAGLARADVITLHEDPNGYLWAGTLGAGLMRLSLSEDDLGAVRVDTLTKKRNGLHHDGIWWIQPDAQGHVWLSSDAGVGRYTWAELNAATQSKGRVLSPVVVTSEQGLPSDELNSGKPGGTLGPDGIVWLPTLNGVGGLLPQPPTRHSVREPYIESVVADGQDQPFPIMPLRAATRALVITYSLPNLSSRTGIRYRVRLDGFDRNWVDVGARREAFYSNLPPGRYTFRVQGSNEDGVWNTREAAVSFVLSPHWWQTLWARLVVLLGALGLGYAAWRWQIDRVRTVELAAKVDARTAELQAERDTVTVQREAIAIQHAELQTLDRLKTDLVASISHEFRTPLMLVLGQLGEVLRNPSLEDAEVQRLRGVVRASKRLERLVSNLLDASRMGEKRPVEKPVSDLGSFVCAVADGFAEVARRAGVSLECTSASEVAVAFEPDTAEGILANLLSNAIKFTPRGGHVRVSVVHDADEAVVRVRDTGIGLSSDHLARVFDRFYQVDGTGTRRTGGAGLGLALSHDWARQLGGSLSAESDGLEFGATFTLRLPTTSYADEAQALPRVDPSDLASHLEDVAGVLGLDAMDEPSTSDEGVVVPRKPLVLVVDDHAAVRGLLGRQLAESFRIVATSSGKQALVAARRQPFDAVVCDVMMPVMDGPAVLKAFRADEQLADVPFLFLTAKDDLAAEIEGFADGADGYLVKPCPPERLVARLSRIIERRRQAYAVLAEATDGKRSHPLAKNEAYVQQAKKIVHERMSEWTFGADVLAEAMFTTVSTLNRTLNRTAGKAAGTFIRDLRMERAAVLLSGGSGVAETAHAVGFRDVEHFSRTFRRYYGSTPSAWKSQDSGPP